MNRRSKELLAGVSTVVALAVGATACGSTNTEHKQTTPEHARPFHIETSNPQGLRIERAAAQIINLAQHQSTRYITKPPYSVGFTIDTFDGGTERYQVQTATPANKASETEEVGVQQTGPGEANFDLTFDAMNNGTWTMHCQTDPFSPDGSEIAEISQNSIYHSSNVAAPPDTDANRLLSDKITAMDTLVDGATVGGRVPSSNNICSPNFG